jgi:phage-related minor tail protein
MSLLTKLGIDASEFHEGMEGAEKKATSGSKNIVGNILKIGAAVGGAVVAFKAIKEAGQFVMDAAMTMDEAYDTIQIATGATGDALDDLQGSLDAVFTSVPTDATTAAEVLSVFTQRTDASGQALEGLTSQMLELSRLTGGDAKSNTELFTRVMGDWSISTENASGVMDEFMAAAQASGAGVDDLMSKVVQFGSPLRLMGFSLEDSLAMFAKWEKEGVNSELVMGSLRIAAGHFADAQSEANGVVVGGVDSMEDAQAQLEKLQRDLALAAQQQAEFTDTTKESTRMQKQMRIDDLTSQISELESAMALGERHTVAVDSATQSLGDSLQETFESIKNNTDASAALAEGMEVFGARAGPDMVAAIREGRFEIEDLVAAIGDSEGAIMAASEATMDWPEKWQLMKNKATKALAPVGMALMDVAGKILDKAMPALEKLTTWFSEKVAPAVGPVIDNVMQLGTAFSWLTKGDPGTFAELLADSLYGIADALGLDRDVVGPFIDGFTDMAYTVGTFITEQLVPFIQEHSEAFKNALIAIGAVLAGAAIASGIAAIGGAIATLANPVTLVVAAVALLAAAWTEDWGGIRTWLTDVWTNTLQPIFQEVVGWLQTNIPVAMQWLSDTWNNVLKPAFDAIWSFISTYIIPVISTLVDVYLAALELEWRVISGVVTEVIVPALQTAWQWLQDTATVVSDTLTPVLETLGDWFSNVAETVSTVLAPVLQWIKDDVIDPLTESFGSIGDKISGVIGFFGDLAEGIKNVKLPDWLTPGSPTPFELGLAGINDEMNRLAGTQFPRLSASIDAVPNAQGGVEGAASVGAASYGNSTVNVTVPLTVYGNADPGTVRKAAQEGSEIGVRSALAAAGVPA